MTRQVNLKQAIFRILYNLSHSASISTRMLLQVITAYRTELSKSPRCVVALLRSSITYGDLHIMEQLLILLPESLATYYSACSSGMPLLTQAVLLDSPISIIQLLLSVSVIACAIDTPVSSDVARGAGVSTTAMLPSARDNNFNVVLNDGATALHAARHPMPPRAAHRAPHAAAANHVPL